MAVSAPPVPTRTFSGTRFVLACVAFFAAFVLFLLAVSPRLLAWTLASAPPRPPHVIAGGEGWAATAVQRGEDPCLVVQRSVLGDARLCTAGRERTAIQRVDSVAVGAAALYYGIVAPQIKRVRLVLVDGTTYEADVGYADYGFPVGFWATEAPPEPALERVVALDSDGAVAADLACTASGCSETTPTNRF